MSTTPDVRPGQIWADNDKRSAGRKVRVIAIEDASGWDGGKRRPLVPARAVVEQVVGRHNEGTGRRTRIRLDRFRPTSTGYRLVQDAPTTEETTR